MEHRSWLKLHGVKMIRTLILTPDGVGSTFLQRTLTAVYRLCNTPVKNIHELQTDMQWYDTGGVKDELGQQKLSKIQETLEKNTDDLIAVTASRDNRLHPKKDQEIFSKFCNNYFTSKIACFRKNVFEYALSWSIRQQTGITNAYSIEDKKKVQEPKQVDINFFKTKCQHYIEYLFWLDEYYTDYKKVWYEDIIEDADAVLDSLTEHKGVFQKNFDITLNDFIKYEYDILQNYIDGNDIKKLASDEKFKKFVYVRRFFGELEGAETLSRTLPIKNTSLQLKKNIVRNYDDCLSAYDEFIKKHNIIDGSLRDYDFWTGKVVQ